MDSELPDLSKYLAGGLSGQFSRSVWPTADVIHMGACKTCRGLQMEG